MARKFTVYPSNYVHASTDVEAKVKTRFDGIREVLGEDEWYYIEDYILNEDDHHSLDDLMSDEAAWDDYCDWKMAKYHKKAALSASTRLKALRYLKG